MGRTATLLIVSLLGCVPSAVDGLGGADQPSEGEGEDGAPGPEVSATTQDELVALVATNLDYNQIKVTGTVSDLAPLRNIRFVHLIVYATSTLEVAKIDVVDFPGWQGAFRLTLFDNFSLTSIVFDGPRDHSTFDGPVLPARASLEIYDNPVLNTVQVSGTPSYDGMVIRDNPLLCNINVDDVTFISDQNFRVEGPCIPEGQIDALRAVVGATRGP
jgi:hypothetical protein